MRPKSLLLLALALGCGLVASIGITQVMTARNADKANAKGDMGAIFVATQDIRLGELITAQMVNLEEWPKGKIPEGALQQFEDVEGRRPKTMIYADTPILDKQLLGLGDSASFTQLIPLGYRAVPVRVDDVSGGAAMIKPGDRVDVLVHLRASGEIHQTTTRTILQDITVFAVNDLVDLSGESTEESIRAKTISLILTPSHTEKVMLATELGKIKLVMRNPDDEEKADAPGAFLDDLVKDSEYSNREKDGSPAHDGVDPFKAFLERSQAQAATEQPVNRFVMTLIEGNEVSQTELVLEDESSPGESAASARSRGGSSFWRMIVKPRREGSTTEAAASNQDKDTDTITEEQTEETKEESKEGND